KPGRIPEHEVAELVLRHETLLHHPVGLDQDAADVGHVPVGYVRTVDHPEGFPAGQALGTKRPRICAVVAFTAEVKTFAEKANDALPGLDSRISELVDDRRPREFSPVHLAKPRNGAPGPGIAVLFYELEELCAIDAVGVQVLDERPPPASPNAPQSDRPTR